MMFDSLQPEYVLAFFVGFGLGLISGVILQ